MIRHEVRFASLTEDKKYLIASTSGKTLIYSNPLSESPILEQHLSWSYSNRISKNEKYLFTTGSAVVRVYVNCNWNTTGGYFYNNDT